MSRVRERGACHGAENCVVPCAGEDTTLLQLIETEITNTYLYTTTNFTRIVSLNEYCPHEGACELNVARFGKKCCVFQKTLRSASEDETLVRWEQRRQTIGGVVRTSVRRRLGIAAQSVLATVIATSFVQAEVKQADYERAAGLA